MPECRMFVGIDLGNSRHAVCVVDDNGKVLKERTVQNDWSAMEALQEITTAAGLEAVDVGIAVEDRHCALVDALLAHRFRVFTINPKQVDRFRDRFSVAGSKDDRKDARVLATTLRSDGELYRAIAAADDDVVTGLRVRNAALEDLDGTARRVCNQLRAIVLRCWPTLLTLCQGVDEAWFWDFLELALRGSVTDEELGKLLTKHRKRKLKVKDLRVVLDQPRLSTARGVFESCRGEAARAVELLRLFEEQRHAIVAERDALLAGASSFDEKAPSDIDLLVSAPGFGPKTTAIIATTILPLLKSKDTLGLARAIAGVAPVTKRSGKAHAVVMRRSCDARVREALHHAAYAAARWDIRFGQIYERLRTTGHSHGRALRGVADRLLDVVCAMLRGRSLYREAVSRVDATPLAPPVGG